MYLYTNKLLHYDVFHPSLKMFPFFFVANVASYAGGLLYFGFFFPWFFINSEYETMTQGQKFASCLPFNTAMAMGFNIIGIHEGTGQLFRNLTCINFVPYASMSNQPRIWQNIFDFFLNPTYLAEYFRRGSAMEQLPQSALC